MGKIETIGENSCSLLKLEILTEDSKSKEISLVDVVDVSKESLEWLAAREVNNIENNAEFFIKNFKRFDEILNIDDLRSSSSFSRCPDLERIRKQEGEVIVPGLSSEEALVWGVKVLNFVHTGINWWGVEDIRDFSTSFKEIYERRLNELQFNSGLLELKNSVLKPICLQGEFSYNPSGDLLFFFLEPGSPYYRFEVEITDPISAVSIDLRGERNRDFLAKYELIFGHIMEIPQLQVKAAEDINRLEADKERYQRDEENERDESPLYETFDSFLNIQKEE